MIEYANNMLAIAWLGKWNQSNDENSEVKSIIWLAVWLGTLKNYSGLFLSFPTEKNFDPMINQTTDPTVQNVFAYYQIENLPRFILERYSNPYKNKKTPAHIL